MRNSLPLSEGVRTISQSDGRAAGCADDNAVKCAETGALPYPAPSNVSDVVAFNAIPYRLYEHGVSGSFAETMEHEYDAWGSQEQNMLSSRRTRGSLGQKSDEFRSRMEKHPQGVA